MDHVQMTILGGRGGDEDIEEQEVKETSLPFLFLQCYRSMIKWTAPAGYKRNLIEVEMTHIGRLKLTYLMDMAISKGIASSLHSQATKGTSWMRWKRPTLWKLSVIKNVLINDDKIISDITMLLLYEQINALLFLRNGPERQPQLRTCTHPLNSVKCPSNKCKNMLNVMRV